MPPINPERWRVLSPYVDQALDIAVEDRPAWLSELSARDATLAADLRSILAQHDQVRVRVSDRVEYVEKQLEPGFDRECAIVAVFIDTFAVHVLEHEIRLASGGNAGVDEMCNARMAEPRQDVALAAEPLLSGAADERDVQQLDRRAPLEAPIAALGQPHAAGAPLAQM